jgi:predicted NAD/FAD-dependent oxidoreductase
VEGGEPFSCRDLVLALALEETQELLKTLTPQPEVAGLVALLKMFTSVPSLTLLAVYAPETPAPDWDILYPEASEALQLVSHDSRKRTDPRHLALVLQGRPRWSRERLDEPVEAWSGALLAAAAEAAGAWLLQPLWTSPHRWLYARVDRGNELARPLLTHLPGGPRLGLAGDVFAPGGGVQAAWLSGSALAQRFLNEER